MEDLKIVEGVCRKDPKVIEQCGIIGIPPEDMHKVYCDRKSTAIEPCSVFRQAATCSISNQNDYHVSNVDSSMDDWIRPSLR